VRRRPTTRFAALLIALFFLLSQGSDALGLHACPLHSAPGHQAAGAVDAGTHAAHASQHGAPHDGGDAEGSCNCVGVCSASAGGFSAPQPRVSWRPLLTIATAAPLDAARSIAPLRRPYLLPYGHAPPRIG
jgi:hypothetical protein